MTWRQEGERIAQMPSQTHDVNGRPYVKLSELSEGEVVELDHGFTCRSAGKVTLFYNDGLYFECADGKHYLSGQADDGEHCVGAYKL